MLLTCFFMREVVIMDAVCRHDPSREKSVYRGPQAAIYANYKNIISAEVAQSKAERIQKRSQFIGPALSNICCTCAASKA